jgi:hypothetical protein
MIADKSQPRQMRTQKRRQPTMTVRAAYLASRQTPRRPAVDHVAVLGYN